MLTSEHSRQSKIDICEMLHQFGFFNALIGTACTLDRFASGSEMPVALKEECSCILETLLCKHKALHQT